MRDGGHAVIMARFANDIRDKMQVLTKELEVLLGPDTEELALRIGMHSVSLISKMYSQKDVATV